MDKLKEVLFEITRTERDEFIWMMQHGDEKPEQMAIQRARYTTAYSIIEEAGLEDEYKAWLDDQMG